MRAFAARREDATAYAVRLRQSRAKVADLEAALDERNRDLTSIFLVCFVDDGHPLFRPFLDVGEAVVWADGVVRTDERHLAVFEYRREPGRDGRRRDQYPEAKLRWHSGQLSPDAEAMTGLWREVFAPEAS